MNFLSLLSLAWPWDPPPPPPPEPVDETPMLIAGDLAAAIIAGAICAPLVAVIDEAITVSAAGKKKMWPAIGDKLVSILKAPLSFLASAPFIWLWAVYALTYASANCTETVCRAPCHACGAALDENNPALH